MEEEIKELKDANKEYKENYNQLASDFDVLQENLEKIDRYNLLLQEQSQDRYRLKVENEQLKQKISSLEAALKSKCKEGELDLKNQIVNLEQGLFNIRQENTELKLEIADLKLELSQQIKANK